MTKEESIVFLVDDDLAVRKTLPRGLRRRGLCVEAFDSAQAFLDAYIPEQPGCLVLDLSMPDMDGLELQQELIDRAIAVPIIFITGHGGVPQSVQAIKAGAIDFLEKPFPPDTLAMRIFEAFLQDQQNRIEKQELATIRARFHSLTKREHEICQLMMDNDANVSNKEVATALGISHRTVEQHRARVLQKMHAKSPSDLSSLAALIKLAHFKID